MGQKIAIDFGTTNSLIACWNDQNGQADFLRAAGLSMPEAHSQHPLIPSLLYIKDGRSGEAWMGHSVVDRDLHIQRDNRLFRNFKRGILAQPGTEARLIDGTPWSDFDAGRRFLQGLLEAVPQAFAEIEQLVVTVPVAAFEGYVSWLSQGVRGVNPEAIRVVDESTAAALGYSVTDPGALALVFDFGGGSLDVSLVQLPQSREQTGGLLAQLRQRSTRAHTARVIAKGGLSLGGSDIDQWLLDEALQRLGFSHANLGADYPAALTACEAAKIALSSQEATELVIRVGGQNHTLALSRAELEDVLQRNGFFAAIQRLLDRVLHVARRQGVFKEDIQSVLLVGGTSLSPAVQGKLRDIFGPDRLRVDRPFTAIAEGALQLAIGFGLEDYLAHSYGLRYLDRDTGQHRFDEIVSGSSRLPSPKPVEALLEAAYAGQKAVEFVIGEIETDAITSIEVCYEDGQAVFVAQGKPETQQIKLLNKPGATVVQLSPPGEPGKARLRARFQVDAQRQLRLSVYDLESHKDLLRDKAVVTLEELAEAGLAAEGPTGCEPRLAERLVRPQRVALRTLGNLLSSIAPDAVSLDAAAEALRSTDFYARYQAADLLSRRGDRDARRVIEDILTHGTAPQRAGVASHLHRFSWFVAEPLLRLALGDEDLRVRESAIYALCRLRGQHAYGLLLEGLPEAPDSLKLAAAWGLCQAPEAESLPVLEVILHSQDPEVLTKGLEAVGGAAEPAGSAQNAAGISVVRRFLHADDLDVRYAAVLSWIELEGERCFPELAQLIQATPSPARACYLRALFHATNYLFIPVGQCAAAEEVLSALESATRDDDSETRRVAVMALAWVRHPQADRSLRAAYDREADQELKARMLFIASQLMSPASPSMLREALAGPDEALAGPDEALAGPDGEVRQTAEYIVRMRPAALEETVTA